MDLADVIAPSSDILVKEVGGEIVLLSLATGTYFGLSDVGMRAWELLAGGDRTVRDLCRALLTEFEVDIETLQRDIAALCSDLEANGLIARAP